MVIKMNKKSIIACLLGIAFIILTILVKTNNLVNFDSSIYNLVTNGMNDGLTTFYKVCTFLGSTAFMVSLCVILFITFIILKRKDIAILEASVLIISTVVNNVVKLIIRRERPEVLKLVIEKSFSFPSGHTMASVTMYGILIYLINNSNLDKRLKIIFSIILGIIPILVMLSRIYLGAHYASDVIGACILSTTLLLIETMIVEKKGWLK